MFASLPIEHPPQDPLFWACFVASLIGLAAWNLYGRFIYENYSRIKWFRRLFLPWITPFLENVDEELDEVDLSRLYVETDVSEDEKVLEVDIPHEDHDIVMESLGEFFMDNYFRPEVLLASLASDDEGKKEEGNWVLTAPSKKHTGMRLHELAIMLISKWQLHVRIFYNEEDETLSFYAHHEYNPYNPLLAKRHFNGDDVDVGLGKEMFRDYLPELNDNQLKNYNYEVSHE